MTAAEPFDHPHSPDCMYCGQNVPFLLPEALTDAALDQSLVIFAGAGISTEVPAVLDQTIYSTIRAKTSDWASDEFPDVMSSYVNQYGRAKLVEEVWNRFDYIRSFSELRHVATRFHRQLATMPYIKEIITTNWDPYFEEECGAIPIVTGADYGLRNLDLRRVYKIHGSINAISTLVATREDYERCLSELAGNALGATLRHLLATKTVVFVGYSLTDTDFRLIYDSLTADLGELGPTRYFVSPFESQEAQQLNMRQIVTDGTYFLAKLKSAMIDKSNYLPDSIYSRVMRFSDYVSDAAEDLNNVDHTKVPGVLYSQLYQQGIRHAIDRILANRIRGEYSDADAVHHKIHSYQRLMQLSSAKDRFSDVPYIEGYLNTLILLMLDDPEVDDGDVLFPPPFHCFSRHDIRTIDDLEKSARNLRRRNRKAWEFAKSLSDHAGPDYIPQHGVSLNIDSIL